MIITTKVFLKNRVFKLIRSMVTGGRWPLIPGMFEDMLRDINPIILEDVEDSGDIKSITVLGEDTILVNGRVLNVYDTTNITYSDTCIYGTIEHISMNTTKELVALITNAKLMSCTLTHRHTNTHTFTFIKHNVEFTILSKKALFDIEMFEDGGSYKNRIKQISSFQAKELEPYLLHNKIHIPIDRRIKEIGDLAKLTE